MFKQFIKEIPFGLSLILLSIAIGLFALIAPIFGNRSLIVRSGSMEPTIKTGDLIVIKNQTGYKTGDIIAFKDPLKPSITVTHRVIGNEIKEGQIFYKTRGDANNSPDSILVPRTNIVGKADFGINGIGKIFAYAKTKTGFLTFIAIPALFVIFSDVLNIIKEIKKSIKHLYHHYGKPMGVAYPGASFSNLFVHLRGVQGRSSTHLRGGVAHRTILPTLAIFMLMTSSFAFFSDSGTSTNNTFAAAPIFPGAPGSVVINEINWAGNNSDPDDEWIELRNMTSNAIDLSSWVVSNLGSGSPGNITIPSGKSISANGFFLISRKDKSISKINVDPDFVTSVSPVISLVNTGEQLSLKTPSSTTIDTANLNSAWFEGSNVAPKKSMERKSTPGDGIVAGNWQTAATHTNMDVGATEFGTPKAENGT